MAGTRPDNSREIQLARLSGSIAKPAVLPYPHEPQAMKWLVAAGSGSRQRIHTLLIPS
jgi:hypothetical protein